MSTADNPAASAARFTTRPGGRWSAAAASASWGSCAAWDRAADSLSAASIASFVSGLHYAATPSVHPVADAAEWIPRPPREVERVG
ncbi:hypothetical protein [Longimicrobium sp.]|uniref:hypothetical protein n=1 Tax=Longimicrobium sp. TaxID=2029185 RepID=UPI003B3A35A8